MNFWKSSKLPLTPTLIFGKSYCGFFIRLYSLKNHTCGIFLKSPGYESIKNNDPCCQIQCLNFKFWGWLGPRLLVHWGFLTIVNRNLRGVRLTHCCATCCCKSLVWEQRTLPAFKPLPSPNLKNCNTASEVTGLMKWNCPATYEHHRPLEYREG